ncbi:MAG: rod shape-determining protein RodA [Candidatus Margulisbacteria bacterium]|jgi:rod shape determining protein RodA|nr:rod shape-determining protein RodA [Candidatus Margulisiibacteriota bacterium]
MDIFKSGARIWRHFDWRLFLTALALSLWSLLVLAAVSSPGQFKRQLLSLGLGLAVFFLATALDYRQFKRFAEILFGAAVFLLLVVLNTGHTAYGAQRWLNLGLFSFQPTELLKLALIFLLAKFLEQKQGRLDTLLDVLPGFALVGLPFFLIFKQPDLGSAIVLAVIFLVMSFWGGMRLSRLLMLASPLLSILALHVLPVDPLLAWGVYLVLLLFCLWRLRFPLLDSGVYFALNFCSGLFSSFFWNSLSLYQRNRILSFINPDIDPLARGVRYHMTKAVIAVGSGGLWGKGWLQGALTNLRYIPQQHTDFIFSVIGEEFGFIGTALSVLLLFYLLRRIYQIALKIPTDFGRYIAIGVLALLSFQSVINVCMNIGLAPVVGLPLPFISYGGTALVMSWLGLGLVQSAAMHRQTLEL